MRTKETGTDRQPGEQEPSIYASARDLTHAVGALACRRPGVLSTTSGPVVVAARVLAGVLGHGRGLLVLDVRL